MSQSKTVHIPNKPPAGALVPACDEATIRFRQTVDDPRVSANPSRLLFHALSYAAETEQRIVALNARLAQLEAVSVTDELTGLLNRRGFDDMLRRNLLSAARYDETGILAFIDLDRFKSINDKHGHAVGDEVLRMVGRFLLKNIRATDYAARLGGDEFAILFVRAQNVPARERAKQLVRGINKLVVPVETGTKISIKASLGLAAYEGLTDPVDLMISADRAMYADKNKGGRTASARLVING